MNRSQRRSGTAAVEFAAVAPLVVVLALGLLEIGRAIEVREILSAAARKGARTGIYIGKSNSDITADVQEVVSDNGISSGLTTITIMVNDSAGYIDPDTGEFIPAEVGTAKQGDKISVQVSLDYSTTSYVASFFLSNGTIGSEVVSMLKY